MSELTPPERIVLAVDTSDELEANRQVKIARAAGAKFVKFGLELSSATSWRYCSKLAESNELEWIADAKLNDIPNTVAAAVRNIKDVDYPPFGITMHATSGIEAMQAAQKEADLIKMFGVTILTSIGNEEAKRMYNIESDKSVYNLARGIAKAGLLGIVCSAYEVGKIKRFPETENLFAMVPGIRSIGSNVNDQKRVNTPAIAIKEGADLIVVGRQITAAEDAAKAYQSVIDEVKGAL